MEDFAFTKAKIAADRRSLLKRVAMCGAIAAAAGAVGALLGGPVTAAALAGGSLWMALELS
jgi:hypothetical protein